MIFAILIFVLTAILPQCQPCGLGFTISSITAGGDGGYKVVCSSRAYPICPERCFWTNRTCAEYARSRNWKHEKLLLSNVTYSYPIKRQSNNNSTQGKTTTAAPAAMTKGIQRMCCNSTTLNAVKCASVEWKPSGNNKFDVGAYAKKNLKCQKDDAILQDMKLKNPKGNELILDVCCLEYNSKTETVICVGAGRGGAGGTGDGAAVVGIGAAIALPLALGIGIPVLILASNCEIKFTVRSDTGFGFTGAADPIQYENVGKDECCAICDKVKASVCNWRSAATQAALGTPGPDTCYTYSGPYILEPVAGAITFIPK